MTEKQFDRWFSETIVATARANWGTGWDRLSEDSKVAEVQARIAVNLMGNHRIEWDPERGSAMSNSDAAALGRHVEKMTLAFRRWMARRQEAASFPAEAEEGSRAERVEAALAASGAVIDFVLGTSDAIDLALNPADLAEFTGLLEARKKANAALNPSPS